MTSDWLSQTVQAKAAFKESNNLYQIFEGALKNVNLLIRMVSNTKTEAKSDFVRKLLNVIPEIMVTMCIELELG